MISKLSVVSGPVYRSHSASSAPATVANRAASTVEAVR